MKHNPSETSAYTPGTPSLPQPIPQEVIPTCKKRDRKYFYGTSFFNVKKSKNGQGCPLLTLILETLEKQSYKQRSDLVLIGDTFLNTILFYKEI